ncbi:MAG: hypothetical protein AB8B99_09760 [Phormidesmis sp.]
MSTTAKQRKQTYWLLEHPEEYPGLPARDECDRKLLLFRYPSFKPSASWSLFKTGKHYWIRRVEWDCSKCFPTAIEPLTFGSEAAFLPSAAEQVLSSLSSIEFCPLKQPELGGIDGTILGITVGNYWLSCSLRWWYLPSNDWKPLAAWFEKTVDTFEQALPESTCRSHQIGR